MSKPNKANAGPGLKSTAPQQSPGAKANVNVPTKTSGRFGQSSEGKVSGKK